MASLSRLVCSIWWTRQAKAYGWKILEQVIIVVAVATYMFTFYKLSHSEGFFYAHFPNMRKLTEKAD